MSSNNSTRQDHRTPHQSGETHPQPHDQTMDAPSKSPQTMKNVSVANASAAESNEREGKVLPQVRNSKEIASKNENTRDANESSWYSAKAVEAVSRLLPFSRSAQRNTDVERRQTRSQTSGNAMQSPEQSQQTGSTVEQKSKAGTAQVNETTKKFNHAMKEKEAELQAKETEFLNKLGHMESQNQLLENRIKQIQEELEHRTRHLEAKVQEAKSEKEAIEVEYNSFIRQKQEEEFKGMESWQSVEGSKVIGDLDKLKRDMRAFGKGMSTKDLSVFQRLDEAENTALLKDLAEVCELTNDGLPEELTSARSPALLLNALLSHHIYTTLFGNPFFFLANGLGDDLPQSGLDSLLDELYRRTRHANREEAHIWRSQTLRLLLPQLRDDTTTQEKRLHGWTSELISNVANLQAAHFLEGPARHLIRDAAKADSSTKLNGIYQMAAKISYMLWTRRATVKCYTLTNFSPRPLPFHPDRKDFIPHSSVKFEEFEDQLKGRPITLIVHPLLQLYGTDDAKDYDRVSTWAPAEVWLDSRKATE